jgi:hypothetical protein
MICFSEGLIHQLSILAVAQVLTQTNDQKMLSKVMPCSDVPSLAGSMPKSLSPIVVSYDSSFVLIVGSLITVSYPRPILLILAHTTELMSVNLGTGFLDF